MGIEEEYEAIIEQARRLDDTGKTDQAKDLLRSAVARAEEAGEEAFAHCLRARLAGLEYDLARALRESEEAARLSPDSPLANTELGSALRISARPREAQEVFQEALELSPDHPRALWGLQSALSDLDLKEQALQVLDRILAQDPSDHFALAARAIVSCNLGRHAEALSAADECLKIEPASADGLRARAWALAHHQRYEEAEQCLRKAADLKPDDPYAQNSRGILLERQGKYDEALERFDAALRKLPRDRIIRRHRAATLGILGRRPEAVRELRDLLREDPDDRRAGRWLFRFEESENVPQLEREQLDDERRREREERERKVKLDIWRRLSGRTAHRVGNQVFAARGALRGLKAEAEAEIGEYVLDIEGSLDRIAAICSEFGTYSTHQPPKPRATDARLLIQDGVRRYRKSAEGIKIRQQIAALLPECRWDPQQVDQAIGELLENAIRHTPPGKGILVKAEPAERDGRQFVRIVVRNEGEGIEARYKARLFEPFFSLRPGGTGLGLAIVSQTIENHGGTIRETGQPGKFAQFEIELPARMPKEDRNESPGDRRPTRGPEAD